MNKIKTYNLQVHRVYIFKGYGVFLIFAKLN